jgi:Protein of unknown function (DUF1592)/Protein of unknown function (DUF1588)/Protein of unknown function (DUF1587)/Protein of unknown function (DUF1595)/Protein of unknown function (DUF1585)
MGKLLIRKKIKWILLSFALVLPYQNCGPAYHSTSAEQQQSLTTTDNLYTKNAFGVTGMRRLSKSEILNSLSDIFSVSPNAVASLPEDIVGQTHFDNDYTAQTISPIVVNAYAYFAESYAQQLVSTSQFILKNAGCQPSSVLDRACFIEFARKVGRLIFRRPLQATEINRLADNILPFAIADNKFATGIEMLLSYFIQHPEFLYRIEESSAPGKLTSINDFEIATRMSYLLWGSAPDDELLLSAEANLLNLESERIAQANRMLANPKAQRQMHSFHAQWLGYNAAPIIAQFKSDMLLESQSLINKVVFENNEPWLNIFSSTETYVTPALASHYGMTSMNSPGWVSYGSNRGGGILAHGSFLSLGAKFGDTSPTVRGYEMYKRLTCGKLGTIPIGVDTDKPPGSPTDCKPVRYNMRNQVTCAKCHSITDGIGFGLENFDSFGKWRTREIANVNCVISGRGQWAGKDFSGPQQLGLLISQDPAVSACATRHLFQQLVGRPDTSEDRFTLASLSVQYQESPQLKNLLIALVKSPAITYRMGE